MRYRIGMLVKNDDTGVRTATQMYLYKSYIFAVATYEFLITQKDVYVCILEKKTWWGWGRWKTVKNFIRS